MKNRFTRSRLAAALGVTLLAGGAVLGTRQLVASDHMDTPEVELNPRLDINDVYVFPGASADRIVLVLTTSSPIVGQNASFDPNVLYQFKIDNNGDAKEDLVIQATFDEGSGANQRMTLRGPAAPEASLAGTNMSRLLTTGTSTVVNVGQSSGSTTGMQVFAGLRRDPFFIDLEQFFKIVPDRRPSTGPLSTPLTQQATSFRSPGVDLLGTLNANALSIVLEMPKSQLVTSTASDARIGVWATTSR
jgi:hypothetical protein